MIRALVVDDEEPARLRLRALLGEFDDVLVVGEAVDGPQALAKIDEHLPDLVFLDIEMPGRNGMQVAASLTPPKPRIVFCTAYDHYALDAFDHPALDYLLKPVTRRGLTRSLERVRSSLGQQPGRLAREVADAGRAQQRLLPRTPPPMPGLDYCGSCRAASGLCGDHYDFLPLGDQLLGVVVADVSGKGVEAGLLMASLQARIQALAPSHRDAPQRLVAEIHRTLHASTASNRYATLFYGLYDDDARTLRYVNAGHNPPLLLGPDGRLSRLRGGGPAVGMLADARYDENTVGLEPGSLLTIYSDGLTEAMNEHGQEFGEQRLEEALCQDRSPTAAATRDALLRAVDRFIGTAAPHDDMTIVVARLRGAR